MNAINKGDPTLDHQVAAWRQDPFDPDAIAQTRPVAYQRAIVMQYIYTEAELAEARSDPLSFIATILANARVLYQRPEPSRPGR